MQLVTISQTSRNLRDQRKPRPGEIRSLEQLEQTSLVTRRRVTRIQKLYVSHSGLSNAHSRSKYLNACGENLPTFIADMFFPIQARTLRPNCIKLVNFERVVHKGDSIAPRGEASLHGLQLLRIHINPARGTNSLASGPWTDLSRWKT